MISRPHAKKMRFVLILCLLGFALRLFRLDAQSIWWDEGISLHLATSGWLEIMANRVVNIHPPLYFFLLKIWVHLVGTTPFAARYLSVLASVLWVPAVYQFTRTRPLYRWWVAVLVVAIWPLGVVYGQEVRVYAFLPLIYLALLGLTERLIHFPISIKLPTESAEGAENKQFGSKNLTMDGRLRLILLALTAWVGLHLHYITFFVVAYVGVWGFLVLARQKSWLFLRQWVLTFVGVAVGSLPWFVAVLLNWDAVQQEATAGTFLAEPVPIPYLLQQVWWFQLTGLAGFDPPWIWLALALAGFLLLLWVWHSWQKKGAAMLPLLQWLIPLVLAFLAWSVRSFAHPRYVIAFAMGWPLLVAYLLAHPFLHRRGLPIVLLMLSLIFGYSLNRYYFDEAVSKPPMREVAEFLAERTTAVDRIIIPDTDWSLQFEYEGEAEIQMAGDDPSALLDGQQGTIYFLDYERGTRDWNRMWPFAIATTSVLVERTDFDDLIVWQYEQIAPSMETPWNELSEPFGALRLDGVSLPSQSPSNGQVGVALRWSGAVDEDYKVGLRLVDETGWVWAQKDDLLLDSVGRPSHLWQQAETYHVLSMSDGAPPQPLTLVATVYVEGKPAVGAVQLGQVVSGAPHPASRNNIMAFENQLVPEPIPVTDGALLQGAAVYPQTVVIGEPITIWLDWQVLQVPADGYELVLTPKDGEMDVVEVMPNYPAEQWQTALPTVVERQLVRVWQAGKVEVQVVWGEQVVKLAEVEVVQSDRTFEPPSPATLLDVQFGDVIRLVGVDVAAADGAIAPTFYWQPLQSNVQTSWIVFAQVLDRSGQIVGQMDGVMGNGRYASSWIAGEYIRDVRTIPVAGDDWQLIVGLYDPNTGERLLTNDGADAVVVP